MKIGIDLLWVRVGKCGGTESFIRNLLSGFAEYDKENEYVLFAAKDNAESFEKYEKDSKNMRIVKCPTKSESRVGRILWENLHLDNVAKREDVDLMYIPVYSMPRRRKKNNIPYVVTIHDLQGWHYPEYFSKTRLAFLKKEWKYATDNAEIIVAISEYTKDDICKYYKSAIGKIQYIYNPVKIGRVAEADALIKWDIEPKGYFYCVSSLLPHKNLDTILKTIRYRKEKLGKQEKLVISGVGGNKVEKDAFISHVRELGIEDSIVLTGFVSNEERNLLYKECKVFLFPSVFEGFGMPPVEAQMLGKPVVTTDRTSIKEVTQGKAIYVDNPFDEKDWSKTIDKALLKAPEMLSDFECFNDKNICDKYLNIFKEIYTR